VFGAATHNTTLGGQHYFICGDYAGFAQEHIESEHPGVQAMFVLGCAGSANPYPRGSVEISREHGRVLGEEVCRVLEEELAAIGGPLATSYQSIELPLQTPPSREQIDQDLTQRGGWRPAVARAMLKVLESGEELPTTFAYPLSVWQFGEDLTLVGLSGEVVGEYVPLIERAVGPGRLWTAAYCHDVFGYLPTAQVLEDGGYETRGAYYRGPGLFAPEAEAVLVENVRRMAEAAGRPTAHFQDEVPAR
jgi:neutral ceramidase